MHENRLGISSAEEDLKAELRDLVAQLRQARNAGRWQTEQNLWADLAEMLKEE